MLNIKKNKPEVPREHRGDFMKQFGTATGSRICNALYEPALFCPLFGLIDSKRVANARSDDLFHI